MKENLYLHQIKFEYISNSKIIISLTFILGLIASTNVLIDQEIGYLTFYLSFLFASSSRTLNKKTTSPKYFATLPVNQKKLLFVYVVGRLVHYLPIFIVYSIFYSYLPKNHYFNLNYPSALIFSVLVIMIFNTFSIIRDIEADRHQNIENKVHSFMLTFKNFVFKYFLGGVLAVGLNMIVLTVLYKSGFKTLSSQYFLIAEALVILYLLQKFSYKKIIDEKLSYWRWSRDGAFVGVILVMYAFPLYLFTYLMDIGQYIRPYKQPLFQYVYKNNSEKIKKYFNEKKDSDISHPKNFDALMIAARWGNDEAFHLLLEKGMKIKWDRYVNSPKSSLHGMNIFHLSLIGKNENIQRTLLSELENHLNIYTRENPLHITAQTCSLKLAQKFYSSKFLESQNELGDTPLIQALKSECYPVALYYYRQGADLNQENKLGLKALDFIKDKNWQNYFSTMGAKRSPAALKNLTNKKKKKKTKKEVKKEVLEEMLDIFHKSSLQ